MKKIVVITSGWVVMGEVCEHTDRLVITDASVIRVWGTEAGLGQIALHGPTPATKLDKAGTIEVYKHAVVMEITCSY